MTVVRAFFAGTVALLATGCSSARDDKTGPSATGSGAAPAPVAQQVPTSQIGSADVKTSDIREIEKILSEFNAVKTPAGMVLTLPADVLFDFDKSVLRPDAASAVAAIAKVIQHYAAAPVEILGHTDSKGDDAYNQRLSEERANSVRDRLVAQHAIAPARLTTAGLGETKPAVANTTPDGADDTAGRQKNRRVEIVIEAR